MGAVVSVCVVSQYVLVAMCECGGVFMWTSGVVRVCGDACVSLYSYLMHT